MRARWIGILAAAAIGHATMGQAFTNPAPIVVPDIGVATPYPSVIHVSDMGPITDVGVVFHGVTHTYIADLDIVLVGPNGVGVYILSDVGALAAFSGGDYGFAAGGQAFPTSGNPVAGTVYAPSGTFGDESFPNVVFTLGASLNTFNGVVPNGDWKLYVVDDTLGDSGQFANGWSLIFNSRAPGNSPGTFTYQGRLDGIQGPVDLRFQLHKTQAWPDSLSATDLGRTLTDVMPDADGVFTVEVPYNPDLLDGTARFLEVAVSPAGQMEYTTLSPRQPVLRAPMAAWANKAKNVPWSGIQNMPSGFADGVDDAGPWTMASANDYVETNHDSVRMTTRLGANLTSESFNALFVSSSSTTGTAINFAAPGTLSNGKIEFTGPSHYGGGSLLVISNAQVGNGALQGLAITSTGLVGVNTYAPTFTLSVNGTAGKPGGGSWSVFSDERLKQGITPLNGTLDKLLSLHGYSFEYTDAAIKRGFVLPGTQIGLKAQEVQCVFPDWVSKDDDGYLYVTERATTALMVEALRDLRAEKDAGDVQAKSRIDELASENAELKARLDRLEKALEAR